jgi:flagellin-like protein
MRKNNATSAIVGVILMIAITVAVAATVYTYVEQKKNNRNKVVEITGKIINIPYGFDS